ncbi:cell wall synthesis protein CwsA [Mycobacterium sp. CVI_P3]|uniref:Cell wall synthesis protein CwsA n=1 Tax=Mycobacterium pinniadriaticum TaxID=2994102 RepID=A0ABT3S9Z6_9MYCO|nr:cell wall synthesis protein CwsA [Mycobacterium pinniadriaticum]MCX2929252.1 cell wall synthesis protein CwsA [Mycobacterium pinniadriaticum]MCX2935677.1 cell wall synthesis protein CwsA [Mycobacterium pinniadriaticum]
MGRRTEPKLTSRERLNRGLHYTAVGPVDITRGVVGVSVHGAESAASALKRRAREARAVQLEVANEAEAVKQVVAELPQMLQEARKSQHRRRRRLVVFGFLGLAVVAGAAVAVTIARRSATPEPSPRPPSVEVTPKL